MSKKKNKLTKLDKYLLSIQWKQVIVDGKETDYQISSNGLVKNIKHNRILEGSYDGRGYRVVSIYVGKKLHTMKVHRLVATAFIPNPENKPTVNHKDGNKTNNDVSNLEWCTHLENIGHAINTGLRDQRGMKGNSNIYTDKQVHKVCKMLEDGKSCRYISEIMGVNINLPRRILYAGKWSHISCNYKLPSVKKLDETMKKNTIELINKGLDDEKIMRLLGLPNTNFNRHFITVMRNKVV